MRSYRADKMSSFIRSLVGEVVANKLNDPRISPMTSVTRVEMSGDLQIAKVYVSVMGTPAEERKTMTGLGHATGHIQRLVGKELAIRQVPEIRFVLDQSIKVATETVKIIDESMDAESAGEDEAPGSGDVSPDGADGAPV
jgi:ribosome-binding factor A